VSIEQLDILYIDDHYVVIDKPSGLLVHRSPIDKRETRFALQILRDQIGQHIYPIHRLDKPTSGAMIFGLHSDAAKLMAEIINTDKVSKTYWAVVRGYAPEEGHIDHALSYQPDDYTDKDRRTLPAPQAAQTSFKRLATVEIPVFVDRYPQSRYSWVELSPHTGRRHQLRRHMKHIGHPIIGDARHGKGVHNRFFQSEYQANRLLLMARELRWQHPYSGAEITNQASMDEAFASVFKAFGWSSQAVFD